MRVDFEMFPADTCSSEMFGFLVLLPLDTKLLCGLVGIPS